MVKSCPNPWGKEHLAGGSTVEQSWGRDHPFSMRKEGRVWSPYKGHKPMRLVAWISAGSTSILALGESR